MEAAAVSVLQMATLAFPRSGLQAELFGWGLLLTFFGLILGSMHRHGRDSISVWGDGNRWLDRYIKSKAGPLLTVSGGVAMLILSIIVPWHPF